MLLLYSKPSRAWTLLFFLPNFLPKTWAQTCNAFGVDFQDGGSYFQNSLSTDDFTFVSKYEGWSLSIRRVGIMAHVWN